jgi:hypothetical protein
MYCQWTPASTQVRRAERDAYKKISKSAHWLNALSHSVSANQALRFNPIPIVTLWATQLKKAHFPGGSRRARSREPVTPVRWRAKELVWWHGSGPAQRLGLCRLGSEFLSLGNWGGPSVLNGRAKPNRSTLRHKRTVSPEGVAGAQAASRHVSIRVVKRENTAPLWSSTH